MDVGYKMEAILGEGLGQVGLPVCWCFAVGSAICNADMGKERDFQDISFANRWHKVCFINSYTTPPYKPQHPYLPYSLGLQVGKWNCMHRVSTPGVNSYFKPPRAMPSQTTYTNSPAF